MFTRDLAFELLVSNIVKLYVVPGFNPGIDSENGNLGYTKKSDQF